MLARAGERAASLGAPDEGQRYYEQAAELAPDSRAEAELLELAGRLGIRAGRTGEARVRLERAIALFEQERDTSAAASASAGLADVDVLDGRLEQAKSRLEAALPALEAAGPSAELAATLAQLGRMRALSGEHADALLTLDRALSLAEALALDEVFAQGLTSKAVGILYQGRFAEARLLLEGAIERARDAGLHSAWFRATGNLAVLLQDSDLWVDALDVMDETEARARQLGEREQLAGVRLGVITVLVLLGRWSEALERVAEADELGGSDWVRGELVATVTLHCERGELAVAARVLEDFESLRRAEQAEFSAMFVVEEARLLRAQGRNDEARDAAERALAYRDELAVTNTRIKGALVQALEARFALDDLDGVAEVLGEIEALQPGQLTPFLRAQRSRFRARLDARQGRNDGVDESFLSAAALFREFDCTFFLAATQLEHAEWLHAQGRADEAEPLLAEARETFELLEARPWLERAGELAPHGEPEAVAAQ
jgi:tetratricopeptide (TPR) repeat protein